MKIVAFSLATAALSFKSSNSVNASLSFPHSESVGDKKNIMILHYQANLICFVSICLEHS